MNMEPARRFAGEQRDFTGSINQSGIDCCRRPAFSALGRSACRAGRRQSSRSRPVWCVLDKSADGALLLIQGRLGIIGLEPCLTAASTTKDGAATSVKASRDALI
jgi:hypothetical protein